MSSDCWKARAVPWNEPWMVGRHADLAHRVVHVGDGVAQRLAERQVERDRAGDEQALMIDAERRGAELVARHRRQRDHRLRRGADGRTGRGRAAAADGDLRWCAGCAPPALGSSGSRRRRSARRSSASGRRRVVTAGGRLGAADRAARGADIDVLQRFGILPVLGRDLHDHVVLVQRVVDGRDLALAEGVVERRRDAARVDAEPGRRVAVDRQVDLQAVLLLVRSRRR